MMTIRHPLAGLLALGLLALVPACAFAPEDPAAPPYGLVDAEAQVLAAAARQKALESLPRHQAMEWKAVDGAARGSITPLRSYRTQDGRYCREFEEALEAGGHSDRFTDYRCRTKTGRWLRPDSAADRIASR